MGEGQLDIFVSSDSVGGHTQPSSLGMLHACTFLCQVYALTLPYNSQGKKVQILPKYVGV